MKVINPPLIVLFVVQLFFLSAPCQISEAYTIPLKKHTITPANILDQGVIDQLNRVVAEEPLAAIIQFFNFPTGNQKKSLEVKGIRLLNYIGGHAYAVSIHQPLSVAILRTVGARAIISIDSSQKISAALLGLQKSTTVIASLFSFVTIEAAIPRLTEKGFTAVRAFGDYPIL